MPRLSYCPSCCREDKTMNDQKTSEEIFDIVLTDFRMSYNQMQEFKKKLWLPAKEAISIKEHERELDELEIECDRELKELESKSVLIEDVEKIIENWNLDVKEPIMTYDLRIRLLQKLKSLGGGR